LKSTAVKRGGEMSPGDKIHDAKHYKQEAPQ